MTNYIDKWLGFVFSEKPTDRQLAEQGIRIAYQQAGLKPPSDIVWFQSPAQLFTSSEPIKHIGSEVFDEIHTSSLRIKQSVYRHLHGTQLNRLFTSVTNHMTNVYHTRGFMTTALTEHIKHTLPTQVERHIDLLAHHTFDGQYSPRSFISFDFLVNHFDVGISLSDYGEAMVAQHAGYWIPFKDVCFIAERCTMFHVDNRDRLHCDKGLALEYPDGWGVYAWHGVHVPEFVIMRPKNITPNRIMVERNTEVARIMIERYGLDNFIRHGDFMFVQSDDYGDLYRIEFDNGDEPIVAVHVQDASTDRDYFLYVPPHIRTAHQGVAWTFGYENPTDYQPDKET